MVSIALPHTISNIKRRILKAESFDERCDASVYLRLEDDSPVADEDMLDLSSDPTYAGLSEANPICIMINSHGDPHPPHKQQSTPLVNTRDSEC